MMTDELKVSILAAPLGQMDRRSLSQAWYTALRLARNASPHSIVPPRALLATATPPARVVDLGVNHRQNVVRNAAFSRARRICIEFGAHERCERRRAQRFTLAQRIERTFAGTSRTKRATFSLGRGDARVHVILQTTGERSTLLAICHVEQRRIVERALSQARLALARRGIGVEFCPIGGSACS
jgi:hypothetical protein